MLALCLATPVQAREPSEMLQLARMGAPALALRLIGKQQPELLRDAVGWVRWEQARLTVLAEGEQWQALADRVNALPAGLPADFTAWARTRQAEAWLRLGEGGQARGVLRDLLWGPEANADPQVFAALRRMLIQSYLTEGLLEDARTALLRYQQDYPQSSAEERILRARMLLRVGEPQQVAQVLAGQNLAEARALTLLSRVQAGSTEPEADRREAQRLAEAADTPAADRARAWLVAARAAHAQGDRSKEVWHLERALVWHPSLGEHDRVFAFGGDDLWQAYLGYGQALGNEAQLLIGDDAAWLLAAEHRAEKRAVIGARSYYAVVALRGLDPELRAVAHRRLAESLRAEDGGAAILAGLYLSSAHFAAVSAIPQEVRYELADYALAGSDIALASRLMAGLVEPPPDVDPFQWQLRRARVHILGGQEDAGIDVLYALLATLPSLGREQADRFLQVVFDLQTVKRHEAAINLFVVLAPRLQDPAQRREVLFWQAESQQALGELEQAAWLYLRSATLLDPHAYDPWAQTCRFHAAEALAEAGLVGDARRLYQDLLRVTHEVDRRVMLRHRLQQLELQQ